MNPFAQSTENDINGLHWLHKFGWLRTRELGGLLWPNGNHSRHQADRLARRWREQGFVIERPLPERSGRALVLAAAGVRMLAQHGVQASSGKDIGEVKGSLWLPPSTWRHDLLTAIVLVDLHQRGFQVLPEAHIRRSAGSLAKFPDGIAIRAGQVVWVETERARKTGRAMGELADAICAVSSGQAPRVAGHQPTHVMVAYKVSAQDERGHSLDHEARVRAAVAAHAQEAARVTWASYSTSFATGQNVSYRDDIIEADRAIAILRRLDAAGWRNEGCLVSNYGHRLARVWEDEETGGWGWQVDERPGGRVSTVSEAKLKCAELLAAARTGL